VIGAGPALALALWHGAADTLEAALAGGAGPQSGDGAGARAARRA
jgi:hypothetical protein